MKKFSQAIMQDLEDLKKGVPLHIDVNGDVVFDGTIADIKKCMSKENWKSLMDLEVSEQSRNRTFDCFVYRLVKPIPNEIENIIEGENENGK